MYSWMFLTLYLQMISFIHFHYAAIIVFYPDPDPDRNPYPQFDFVKFPGGHLSLQPSNSWRHM